MYRQNQLLIPGFCTQDANESLLAVQELLSYSWFSKSRNTKIEFEFLESNPQEGRYTITYLPNNKKFEDIFKLILDKRLNYWHLDLKRKNYPNSFQIIGCLAYRNNLSKLINGIEITIQSTNSN